MDPYVEGQPVDGIPEVRLERTGPREASEPAELQGPAGDGFLTASDGDRLLVLRGGSACAIPDAFRDRPVRFAYEPGFPLGHVCGSIVRPALQVAMLGGGSVALHATAVTVDGGGVAIAGWSESGKTETGLALHGEGRALPLGQLDSVSGAGVGNLSAFPIGVGIRRWVLRYLPQLRSSLPRVARGRLAASGFASVAARRSRARLPADGRLGHGAGAAGRMIGLAERVSLAPSKLWTAYDPDS